MDDARAAACTPMIIITARRVQGQQDLAHDLRGLDLLTMSLTPWLAGAVLGVGNAFSTCKCQTRHALLVASRMSPVWVAAVGASDMDLEQVVGRCPLVLHLTHVDRTLSGSATELIALIAIMARG